MAVTYKDIDQLTQKSSVAGTEKLPVSDTQYITPGQISGLSGVSVESVDNGADLDIGDESGHSIVRFISGQVKTKYFDSAIVPKYVLLADEAEYNALATKDAGTLYLIPKTS